jgi:predicted O-methyltransferase YrrM
MLNPATLANIASSGQTWREILSFHGQLATDEYVEYLHAFYQESIRRFGDNWVYLDIVNVLYAAAKTLQPENYLEIGVRRGRSVCSVARGCPSVKVVACDMWQANYAGMENPGPGFVADELRKHGFSGAVEFLNGDSHVLLPDYFERQPEMMFDLITVDGDHSEDGALEDLCTVIPRLSIGGILVFDDIAHPDHPYLRGVWRRALNKFPDLSGYEFTEIGYGVAFAIRRR